MADKATGFSLDKTSKQWKISNFDVGDSKYLISKSQNPKSKYGILRVGEEFEMCDTVEGFNEYHMAFFSCADGKFRFNKKNGRYLRSAHIGYVHGDTPDFTPFIEMDNFLDKYNKSVVLGASVKVYQKTYLKASYEITKDKEANNYKLSLYYIL